MSENVKVVRSVYAGWARGDFSGDEAFDRDVEFEMPDWPFTEVEEHVVVVLNRIEARGKGSGAEVRAYTATVWTLDEGRS